MPRDACTHLRRYKMGALPQETQTLGAVYDAWSSITMMQHPCRSFVVGSSNQTASPAADVIMALMYLARVVVHFSGNTTDSEKPLIGAARAHLEGNTGLQIPLEQVAMHDAEVTDGVFTGCTIWVWCLEDAMKSAVRLLGAMSGLSPSGPVSREPCWLLFANGRRETGLLAD